MDTATTPSASQVTGSGTASANGGITGSISQTMNKDDFLKLLVTQLQYQDPLSPEDPKDFVAQLAQFSSLEQQINSNTNLENLSKAISSLQQSQSMAQGVSLLGKTVKGSGNQLTVVGGKVMEAAYSLPKAAKQVAVGIFDSSGNQVAVVNLGAQTAGSHTFTWDGKDSKGQQAADGLYSYQIAAQDQAGNAIQVDNYFTGTVTEVHQDSKGVWVTINGRQILIGNITSVVDGS
uniref:Basal-body rod modification protein FlgD n=1 Tax=Desulfobacca acetoxidans TaxID=60893 RepID=A0A7V6DPR1_9BACT